MKGPFIHEDFLLPCETARELYHKHAAHAPVIDFHNHLDPRMICEDLRYGSITEAWLGHDHYKWRAMRANGIPERLITGDGDAYEKFEAWADTVQNCFGNPLYHWTHLELKRFFDIDETLRPETAGQIYEECNEKLQSAACSARSLLQRQGVKILCTSDDPADPLTWHKKIRAQGTGIQVLPSFRPGAELNIGQDGFREKIEKLGYAAGIRIAGIEDLIEALRLRLLYFIEQGCRVTDHSLEGDFFRPAGEKEADAILRKALAGSPVSDDEAASYRGYLLAELGKLYADHNLVMQLHIGAIRNMSTRLFDLLGADAGADSLADFSYAPQLGALMDAMDRTDRLPRMILYYLNPKDTLMLAGMAGNFQGNEKGIRSKVQLGSAWWFGDNMHGMEEQLQALCDVGLLSGFVGMVTDSRSFLSFPRHEYFRRILCGKIGLHVEEGLYPRDMDYLGKMVEDICAGNALSYFGFNAGIPEGR